MKLSKRLMALILCVCMLSSLLLPAVYAEDTSTGTLSSDENKSITYDFIKENLTYLNLNNLDAAGAASKITTLNNYFNSGAFDWTYAADTISNTNSNSFRVYTASVNDGRNRQLHARTAVGEWLAIIVRSPGAGTYTMTLEHNVGKYGAKEAEIYVLPASAASFATTLQEASNVASINAALASSAKVGTVDFEKTSSNTTAYGEYTSVTSTVGQVTLGDAQTYVVVFKVTDAGEGNSYMWMQGMTLSQGSSGNTGGDSTGDGGNSGSTGDGGNSGSTGDGGNSGSTGTAKSVLYDFQYETANGNVTAKESDIISDYAAGTWNWYYKGTNNATEDNVRFRNDESYTGSIQVRNFAIGEYVAFALNTSAFEATDTVSITMEHPISNYGCIANVYILDKDTADIAAAIKTATPIGIIDFNKGTKLNPVYGTEEYYKSEINMAYNFSEGDEHIIVFEAKELATYVDRTVAYMYLSELTIGDPGSGSGSTGSDADINVIPSVDVPDLNEAILNYDFFISGMVSKGKVYDESLMATTDAMYAAGEIYLSPYITRHTYGEDPNYRDGSDSTIPYKCIRANVNAGDYVAFRMAAPGTGEYVLSLEHGLNTSSARKGNVYVIPFSIANSQKALEDAIADDTYLVGSADFKTGNGTANSKTTVLGAAQFVSGEEYVIVFKAITSKASSYTQAQMLLISLTAAKKDYTDGIYNFVQNAYIGKNSSDTLAGGSTVFADLKGRFDSTAMNWHIENMSVPAVSFTASGLTVNGSEGDWIAYRVLLPGSGTYGFTLNYTASSKGAQKVRVYLIEAADGMTQNDIFAAMLSENLLGTVSFNGSGASTAEIGTGINMTAGEYLVVFQVYQGSESGAQMQFGKISVSTKNMVEYNFDLADKNNGLDGFLNYQIGDKLAELDSLYANGTLNWKYFDAYNTRSGKEDPLTGADFRRANGLRIMSDLDSWYAFTIKAPGAGTYTLSLDYCKYLYGASECAIYVIEKPAAGTDMKALVNKMVLDEDPFALVNLYSEGTKDGCNAILGAYDFKADKEYVVIFYSMAPRPGYTSGVGYMMISHLIAVEGVMENTNEKQVNSVNLGESCFEVSMRTKIGLAEIDGIDYYYLPIEGGSLLVYNLDTMEKVAEVETGIGNAWSCNVDSEGTCYVAGDAKYIFKYNVVSGLKETLYFAQKYSCAYDLEVAENGDIYFGHRGEESKGGVVKYDVSEGEFIWYKNLDPRGIAGSCDSVAYHDGFIYCNISGYKAEDDGSTTLVTEMLKINEATGEIVARVDMAPLTANRDPELYVNSDSCTFLTVVGDLLIGGATYLNRFICFDINTMEYVDLGLIMGNSAEVSEIKDGKVYCVLYKGSLVEIDIEARTGTYLQGWSATTVGFRCHVNTFVTMNHTDLPGESLFTCSTGNHGGPVIYNLQTKATVSYPEFTKGEGAAKPLRTVYASNDGSGLIFTGAYATNSANAYNVHTDQWQYQYLTTGQTDSLYMYEGKLYCGGYSSCTLGVVDYKNGNSEELLCLSKAPNDYHQKRIHCITGGDGKIFFSTVPTTGELGGCLAIFEIDTYDYLILDDFVHNQIILNMFYKDGLLFGSTSVSGGTDSKKLETVSKIFVYDVKNNIKLGEFAVDLEGLPAEIPFIAGLSMDESGKMWGVVDETLFSFTYDRKSNKMAFTEELSFSKDVFSSVSNGDWFGRPIIFHEGYIYYSFPNAMLRKINMKDPSDNTVVLASAPRQYAIGEDGNLYYADGNDTHMLSFVHTDADWDVAAKVEAKIAALDATVTLSNMSKLQSVLNEYNALTDEQKCLIQNYSRLTTLHRRMVVTLINALPSEITLNDLAQVEEARAQYEALPVLKQRFVTNIGALEDAEGVIRNLKYLAKSEEAAALVMKHIENIPAEITLAAAGKINVARSAYDALTDYQKSLVTNYQKLLDAEAALAVLVTAQNQVYADKVIAQIDALGIITLRSEKAIMMARLAYESLSPEQKELVTNYQKLLDAEAELARLKVEGDANVKAVEIVEALINQIGDEITLDSLDVITAAREAYDALTDFQKTLVNNYDLLTQAEALYAELVAERNQTIALVVTIVIVAVVLVAGAVTLFVIPATRAKILGMFKGKKKAEAESNAE